MSTNLLFTYFGFGISGPTDANFRISSSSDTSGANAFDNSLIDITSDGNVGIGTTSPSQLLEINGASNPAVLIKDTTNNVIAYTFADDSVANFGSASAHPVVFKVNDTERVRIDTSGNLGVGTTSPDRKLHVAGDWIRVDDGYGLDTSGGTEKVKLDNGFISLTTSSSERVRIDSSGRLLVGTTTPGLAAGDKLTLAGSGDAGLTIRSGSSNSGSIYFSDGTTTNDQYRGLIQYTHNGDYMRFLTANTERIRLFSDGVVAVNTVTGWFSRYFVVESTSSGGGTAAFLASNTGIYPVSVCNYATSGTNSLIGFWTDSRSSPTQRGDIDYNRGAGQVRYNVTSDRRLKSNIEPAESATDLLSSIQVRSYTWTESQYKVDYGFVAQELHDHVPDAVKQGDDGDEVVDAWSIDNSKLVPVLTKALQEAIAKIEALEAKVAALEAE